MIELAGIIILGILAQWLAWKTKVPAILPLILIGLLVGPIATLWTEDGTKLIEPIFDGTHQGILPSEYLFSFVSLAIGIILFEGGLTLKKKELIGVGPVILKLITLGSLVTFIGAGIVAHYIMQLNWAISFLFAALIIVTGPTVIAPILQNIPLNRNVATVLKWEGILIDPIGALVAVVVFEFIRSAGGLEFTSTAFISFSQVIMIGLATGTIGALILYQLIKFDLVPHYLLNVFTLALVLAVFVFSDVLAHESGLLSVVVMGMVLGNMDVPLLKEILSFKESLSILLISVLFIMLAAMIDMEDLNLLIRSWRPFALFGFVVFVLRPLGVFISTRKSELRFNEKLFISWVGPRGIVAAGIASLFDISLSNQTPPAEDAMFLTPLVFLIVLGTVLLNATTARPIAHLLRVIQEQSNGVLIIGASKASRLIAAYLTKHNRHVVLIDNSEANIKKALNMGIEAFQANVYTDDLNEHFELLDMGYMLAMTGSEEVNNYVVKKYEKIFGENGTYRLLSADELRKGEGELPPQGIFSYKDDFINISEVVRDYDSIHEIEVRSTEHLKNLYAQMNFEKSSIPIFLKMPDGDLRPITQNCEDMEVDMGCQLVYLGKELSEVMEDI